MLTNAKALMDTERVNVKRVMLTRAPLGGGVFEHPHTSYLMCHTSYLEHPHTPYHTSFPHMS